MYEKISNIEDSNTQRTKFDEISVFTRFSQHKRLFKILIPLILFSLFTLFSLPAVAFLAKNIGAFATFSPTQLAAFGVMAAAPLILSYLVYYIVSPKGIGQLARHRKKWFGGIGLFLGLFGIAIAYSFGHITTIATPSFVANAELWAVGVYLAIAMVGTIFVSQVILTRAGQTIAAYSRGRGIARAMENRPRLLPEIIGFSPAQASTNAAAPFSVFSLNAALFTFGGAEDGRDELEYNGVRAHILPQYIRKLAQQRGAFDCISLQEVSPENAEIIRDGLQKQGYQYFYFPDDQNPTRISGAYDAPSYRTAVGSGLFIASRHPILRYQFHAFDNNEGTELLATKGVAAVEILKKNAAGDCEVRTLYSTHEHAGKGICGDLFVVQDAPQPTTGTIRDQQTQQILAFMESFTNDAMDSAARAQNTTFCGEIFVGDVNRDMSTKHKQFGYSKMRTQYSLKAHVTEPAAEKIEKHTIHVWAVGKLFHLKYKTIASDGSEKSHDIILDKNRNNSELYEKLMRQFLAIGEHESEPAKLWKDDFWHFLLQQPQALFLPKKDEYANENKSGPKNYKLKYPGQNAFMRRFQVKTAGEEEKQAPTNQSSEQIQAFQTTTESTNFASVRWEAVGGPKGIDRAKILAAPKVEAKGKPETQSGTDTSKVLLRKLRKKPIAALDKDTEFSDPLLRTNGKVIDLALGRKYVETKNTEKRRTYTPVQDAVTHQTSIIPTLIRLSRWGRTHSPEIHALSDHQAVVIEERQGVKS